MFEILDRRANLTGNQIKILTAAIIGDALEFFDYFLIGFVLAFLIGPWKLTFGQSAVVLMSSGIGGLYCVDLPLVQEFMPSSKRGWVGGIVTCVIPLGVGLGAVMGALVGSGQWRLLFAVGVLPALLVLLVRLWVPESPRWLCRQ